MQINHLQKQKFKSFSTISSQISCDNKKATETKQCQTTADTREWCDCLQKTRLGLDPFDSKLSAPRCTTRWESEAKVGHCEVEKETRLQCWILIELENIGCCFERWAFEIRKGVILESSGTLKLWSTPLFKFSYQDIGFAACIEVHSRDVWSCTELSTLTDFWCLCTSRLLDSRYFLTCSCLYMA